MKEVLPGLPALGDRPATAAHLRREKAGPAPSLPGGAEKHPPEETR